MENNGFVDYLNTLHNEQANNENALAEAQQNNPYFKKVKVERPEAQYIANRIETGENACLMILTGHAFKFWKKLLGIFLILKLYPAENF